MPISYEELEKIIATKQFKYGATGPTGWRFRARCLRWAAERMFGFIYEATCREFARLAADAEKISRGEHPGSGSRQGTREETADMYDKQMTYVYLSLMGSAVENLLKGILMAQHPEYLKLREDEWHLTGVKDHGLCKLFTRCGLPVASDEEEVLTLLTQCVVWMGRYPVPLKESDLSPKKGSFWNLINSGVPAQVSEGHQRVTDLCDRLFEELGMVGNTAVS